MLHKNAKIFSDIAETSVDEATDVLLETMNAYQEVSVADALKTIGVRLTNDFGEYKSLPTILGEISDKWDGLSKRRSRQSLLCNGGDEDEVKARNCTREIVVTSVDDFDKQEDFLADRSAGWARPPGSVPRETDNSPPNPAGSARCSATRHSRTAHR